MPKHAQTIEVESKLKEVGFQVADYKITSLTGGYGFFTDIRFKEISLDKALQLRHALIARGLQITIVYNISGKVIRVIGGFYPGIEAIEKEITRKK